MASDGTRQYRTTQVRKRSCRRGREGESDDGDTTLKDKQQASKVTATKSTWQGVALAVLQDSLTVWLPATWNQLFAYDVTCCHLADRCRRRPRLNPMRRALGRHDAEGRLLQEMWQFT